MITKEILKQCADIREEIKDLNKRIEKLNKNNSTITDSVRGSSKYFPYTEHNYVITGVNAKKELKKGMCFIKREDLKRELEEVLENVTAYIDSLPNSRLRRIFRYRYEDNMEWLQIAFEMGGNATSDSIRMEHDRYMKSKEV